MPSYFSAAALLFVPAAFCFLPGVLQNAEPTAGIYIPADKRHKGLSHFDGLPYTDRKLGDPDRYRALNPNFVKHKKGRYYFLLTAQPNTPYFDEAGKQKGILTETADVPVDLAQTKDFPASGGDGSQEHCVYVQNKGYIQRNRLTPATEIRDGKWFRFPLKSGTPHRLFDGTGIVRGTMAAQSVRLNYGQQKEINGERCYYAFSTSIILDGTKQKSGASGWIKASAIENGNDPGYAPEVVRKMQPAPTPGATFTRYELTGGEPGEKADGTDASGKPRLRWGYRNESGAFISYKVLPGVPLTGRASIAAADYLKRNDNVINLGFNACGVSNDTYRVSSAARPLFFHRSSDKEATVYVDLFFPKDAGHDGLTPVGKMEWVYGYVAEKESNRWGWVPLHALRPCL